MDKDRELELLRKVADAAEFVLIETRREFPYGELSDVDKLEDTVKAWRAAGQEGGSQ